MDSTNHVMNSFETPQCIQAKKQRSHILFVLSNPINNQENKFRHWYNNTYMANILQLSHVISIQHFQKHKVDITMGHFPSPPFRYVGIYELCLDGADQAGEVIDQIFLMFQEESSADKPVAWLYYPISEKVGYTTHSLENPSLILAFSNAIPGKEMEFREWYSTRHLRHALYVPIIISGQCFESTIYQHSDSDQAPYNIIAIYEIDGTAQDFLNYRESIPQEVAEIFHFPSLDISRFGESVYFPISKKHVLSLPDKCNQY